MEETAWYPTALPASSIGHDSHKTLLADNASGRPVKQGWILQKRSFIPFSGLAWKPKYMVLLMNKSSKGPCLQVFDQCDQSKPPRCEVSLSGMALRTMEERQGAFRFPFSRRKLSILGMTPNGGKEIQFATTTRSDREDWVNAITSLSNGTPQYQEDLHKTQSPSRRLFQHSQGGDTEDPNLTRTNSVISTRGYAAAAPDSPTRKFMAFNKKQSPHQNQCDFYSLSSPMRQRARSIEDDAVSTYSALTFNDSASRGGDSNQDAQSDFETLSFCSGPVFTADELASLAQGSVCEVQQSPQKETVKRKIGANAENGAQRGQWYERYLQLMELRGDPDENAFMLDTQILELIGYFKEQATARAKLLIDNYHIQGKLPTQSANSPEFIEDGISYIFACNYDDSSPDQIQAAVFETSQELRASDVLTRALCQKQHGALRIHTCLMALVDYKGFRVRAQALSATEAQSEVIMDLLADYPKIADDASDIVTSCCQLANLKPHTVQLNRGKRLSVAYSINLKILQHPHSQRLFLKNTSSLLPLDNPTDLSFEKLNLDSLCSQDVLGVSNESGTNDKARRFRPEFVVAYHQALSADALTSHSSATTKERDVNDIEALKASKYLRENWIPAFVKRLDSMELRPIDSHSLSKEMHRAGVNIRYLGLVAQLSTLPHIRDIACIEMVARAAKYVFYARLRNAVLHFKSVGATQIDGEMRSYASLSMSTLLGKGDRNFRYFEEKIRGVVLRKYSYDMTYDSFMALHRPALFGALQYQCGMLFEESNDYDFDTSCPINTSKFVRFVARTKSFTGIPKTIPVDANKHKSRLRARADSDDSLAYQLTRYIKSIGPKAKLSKSEVSSFALCSVAAQYCDNARFEEAQIFAQAAMATSSSNSPLQGISEAIQFQALSSLRVNGLSGPDTEVLSKYQSALASVQWSWGEDHPLAMAVYDRLSLVYLSGKDPENALQAHFNSLCIAENSLGKNHPITAGYLAKAGCLLFSLKQTDAAIEKLTEALHIYEGLKADPSFIAEVHFHFSECLEERGDLSAALKHALLSKKYREKCFGLNDSRSVDSFRLVARLLLAPYKNYHGVVTPPMKKAYGEAILCLEKVFRYLKSVKTKRTEKRRDSDELSGGQSASSLRLPYDTDLFITNNIAGPLVTSPFGPKLSIPRSLLHNLTKEIVSLKLALVDSPKHREVIRSLRGVLVTANDCPEDTIIDPAEAKGVIVRLAAVSPSIYLDGIFQRIDDNDEAAMEELKVLLLLTEHETVGLSR